MIKVVIVDADTPLAGELLRLLVNHPDVDVCGLVAPKHAGENVTNLHHGLIGEPEFRFRSDMPKSPSVIFYCGNTSPDEGTRAAAKRGDLKIIDLSRSSYADDPLHGAVPAISEIFRKPLVRGAAEARILSPIETVLMISLFPLARNLMLSSALSVDVEMSPSVARDIDAARAGEIASRLLRGIQQSFEHPVEFRIKETSELSRGLSLRTSLKLAIPVSDLKPLYDEVYDDHNFTFLTPEPRPLRDVVGTNRCLIYLKREEPDLLTVEAVADARMRGWAGEAVLAMNLMFGLYERIGLQLKASCY